MRSSIVIASVAFLATSQPACAQEPSAEQQIAEATSPLPAPMRDGATVLGYRRGKSLVTLREGSNEMICLAPDRTRQEFHVACYHRDLEPFMARGRQLRAQGKDRGEVQAMRKADIEAGKLKMPNHPAALYSLTAGTFDPKTGTVEGARRLYVVYVPYATEASLGISAEPAQDRPWLMFPGEPWAHIMMSQ